MKNKMLLGIITMICLTHQAAPIVHAGLLGKAMRMGAAGVAAAKVYRSTAAGAGALTVPMLEECIRLSKTIDDSNSKFEEMDNRIEVMEGELKKLRNYIDTNKDTVDTTSQQAVDVFNGKVNEYQSKVAPFNQLIEDRNKVFEPYQASSSKFKERCSGQEYYEDDYQRAKTNVGYGISK